MRYYNTPLKPKVILLSGPPGAGKDTVGLMIAEACNTVTLRKFAQPLIDAMQAVFGVSCADGMPKEAPCDELYGRARREVAISLSQEWMKPNFGQHVFGKIMLERINSFDDGRTTVVTDSGFHSEADVLLSNLPPGSIEQVRISRPGHDFTGDSRAPWSDRRAVLRRFLNDGTIQNAQDQVQALLEIWTK